MHILLYFSNVLCLIILNLGLLSILIVWFLTFAWSVSTFLFNFLSIFILTLQRRDNVEKIILYISFFGNVLVRYRVRCVRNKKGRFILYYYSWVRYRVWTVQLFGLIRGTKDVLNNNVHDSALFLQIFTGDYLMDLVKLKDIK